MTLIDFYVLPKQTLDEQHHFACRLIEKAVRQGNRVMVATKDEDESKKLDDTLWSFRPDAFVPHTLLGDTQASESPVIISHGEDDDSHHDVLINLRLEVPAQFSRFKRLAEVVIQDTSVLENSRRSYAFYKKRGYPINTHKL
ncbi:MAG: DNA polymerase III subunit chi [Agarilytica sp.]